MLKRIEENEFDRIYEIMEKSFPLDEIRTHDGQKSLFCDPAYVIYTPDNDGGAVINAFIAVWELEDTLFVEHFAVDPDYRNAGVGSRLLNELVNLTGKDKMICLEVELPDTDISKRRIGFYERNGFVLNHYPYIQPPLSDGRSSVPLKIMTYGRPICENEFEKIKTYLYTRVYKRLV